MLPAPDPRVQFRKLFLAPDAALSGLKGGGDGVDLLATWSAGTVAQLHVRSTANGEDASSAAEVTLSHVVSATFAFPPNDLAWCPFKCGAEDSCFLVAANGAPLRLVDTVDGASRASYRSFSAAGVPVSPQSVLWRQSPVAVGDSAAPSSVDIVAGYGAAAEDKCHLRFFDALCDGGCEVAKYFSPLLASRGPSALPGNSSHRRRPSSSNAGIVGALTAVRGHEHLVAFGCLNRGEVELVDVRRCCPALSCIGLRSDRGVGNIRSHPANPNLLYASGRMGEDRILCWDLRQTMAPLFQLRREIDTNQTVGFDFIQRNSGPVAKATLSSAESREVHEAASSISPEEKWILVSATHGRGGIAVFAAEPHNAQAVANHGNGHTVEDGHRLFASRLGPTSGLSSIAGGFVAVTTGRRSLQLRDRYDEAEAANDAGSSVVPTVPSRASKRPRAPLDGDELLDSLVSVDFQKSGGASQPQHVSTIQLVTVVL